MPINESTPWNLTTWPKQTAELALRSEGTEPKALYRIIRVIAERHHRLWVHHAGGRYLLDYADVVRQLPQVPSWSEWRDCWIADDGQCLRWPFGLSQVFGPERNALDPVVLHELEHSQELFRPLRDEERDRQGLHAMTAVLGLYHLTDEQVTLMLREYAAEPYLTLQRLADLAGYVQVHHLTTRGFRRASQAGIRKARKYLLEYLNLPPQPEWLRAQYPTRLSVILAGGIHQVEKEWLGDAAMKRARDSLSHVL